LRASKDLQPVVEEHAIVSILDKISRKFNFILAALAGFTMMMIMVLIVSNVIIRIFYVPIPGVNEMAGWLSAITVAFALGYTQIQHGHIDIDLVLEKFSHRVKNIVRGLMLLISMFTFLMISYQLVKYANGVMESGVLSETLAIIYYPLIYLLALGFFGLTLTLLTDSIKYLIQGSKSG
jgi:TRAP-type C4-dicarboxylate transport system permease small subunit